jgi:hypothetical protein
MLFIIYLDKMIPLPNLPTDNLYKFLFVFGIILLIASMYFSVQNMQMMTKRALTVDSVSFDVLSNSKKIEQIGNRIQKLQGEITVAKQADSIYSASERIQKKHSALDVQKMNSIEKKLANVTSEKMRGVDTIKSLVEVNSKFTDSLKSKVDRIRSRRKIEDEEIDFYLKLTDLVFWLGLYFTVFGGIMWYFKSQRHIDRITYLQTKKLEIELNSETKASGRMHFEPLIIPRRNRKNS